MIQIGNTDAWLWVAIEPIHHQILGIYISRYSNILVADVFLRSLIKLYAKHTVYVLMMEEDHGILKHVLL